MAIGHEKGCAYGRGKRCNCKGVLSLPTPTPEAADTAPVDPVAPGDLEGVSETELGYIEKNAGLCGSATVKRLIAEVRRLRASSPAPAVPAPPGVREAGRYLAEEGNGKGGEG